MTYTPGPWHVDSARKAIGNDNGQIVVDTRSKDFEMTASDAALLTAAPDLVAVLTAFVRHWGDGKAPNRQGLEMAIEAARLLLRTIP